MTGSIHLALGAALGRRFKSKPMAYAVGVLSHLIGDIVPHQDVGLKEVPLMVLTLARIVQCHGVDSSQFWGAVGAITPDLEHIPYELTQDPRRHWAMKQKLFPTHNHEVPHGEWEGSPIAAHAMNVALFVGGLYLAGSLLCNKNDKM